MCVYTHICVDTISSGCAYVLRYTHARTHTHTRIPQDHFAARWIGEMQIIQGGNYTFMASSHDGCRVVVKDMVVVENDGVHPMQEKESEPIELQPGFYPVTVRVQ